MAAQQYTSAGNSQATAFDVQGIVDALHGARQDWRLSQNRSSEPGGREFPSRDALAAIVDLLKGALFPMRLGPVDLRQESEDFYVGYTLDAALHALLAQTRLELRLASHVGSADKVQARAYEATAQFARALPEIRRLLDSDVLAAFKAIRQRAVWTKCCCATRAFRR